MDESHKHAHPSVRDMDFFDDFYKRNCRLIFYFANRYAASDADREDLMQDVVIRLMNYIPTLRAMEGDPGHVANYICAATRSVFIDRLRNQRKSLQATDPNGIPEALIEDTLVSQRGPHTEAYWDVAVLKQRLPQRDWTLLEGKYIIGYSDGELADMINCAKDSVRTALSRAKKKAREILADHNDEGVERVGQ